jgi:galactokinase
VAFAPGRINLIGEHTDYNGGYVLPMPLGQGIAVAAARREDALLRVRSLEFAETLSWDPAALVRAQPASWGAYVAGMRVALDRAGLPLGGADLLIASDLPAGAGLSSSAALEVSAARALVALAGAPWDPEAAALMAHRVENDFVGVHSGVMDPFAIALGEPHSALFLDCRSLARESVPVRLDGCAFVLADSGVRRKLDDGRYNARRAECSAAVALLRRWDPGIRTLRDATEAILDRAASDGATDPCLRRARHVVSENGRVLRALEALAQGDAPAFGALLNASHESLARDFEVSCPELDRLVSLARADGACFGARLVGAGFGGCTLNLVAASGAEAFRARLGQAARTFLFEPGMAAHVVD